MLHVASWVWWTSTVTPRWKCDSSNLTRFLSAGGRYEFTTICNLLFLLGSSSLQVREPTAAVCWPCWADSVVGTFKSEFKAAGVLTLISAISGVDCSASAAAALAACCVLPIPLLASWRGGNAEQAMPSGKLSSEALAAECCVWLAFAADPCLSRSAVRLCADGCPRDSAAGAAVGAYLCWSNSIEASMRDLPPGAAHMSKTVCPDLGSSIRAGRRLASSNQYQDNKRDWASDVGCS